MADARDKASPGDPLRIRAATWNQLVDIVEETAGGPGESKKSESGRITISLNATTHINPYSVVGFSDPVWAIDDSDDVQDRNDSATLNSAAPSAGRWAICQGGAHIGDNVNAVLVGVTWAKINITDITHGYCEYTGGGLASVENGYARILWKPAGVTGSKWVVLQLGCSQGTLGGGGGGEGDTCFCDLVQWILDSLSMSAIEREALEGIQASCCPVVGEPIACVHAASGFVTSPMLVDIDGVNFTTGITDFDNRAEFAVNTRHEIPMTNCYGAVAIDITYDDGFGGTATDTVTVSIEKRAGDWRLIVSEDIGLNQGIVIITTPGDDSTIEYDIASGGKTSSGNIDVLGISGTVTPP